MKHLFILLLLALTHAAGAQNTAPFVSLTGMGEIRVGMKKGELEKLLKQTFKLKNLAKKDTDAYQDTVHFSYKGVEMDVMLQRGVDDNSKEDIFVNEVHSKSALLKTKSGIGIGDDKVKIVTTYSDFMMHLVPEYEADLKTKSKSRSTVWLFGDTTNNVIIFYLTDGKVTGFSVQVFDGC